MRLVPLLTVTIAGCGLEEALGPPEDTEPVATVDCGMMPADTCETWQGCTTIFGRPISRGPQGGGCYDADVPLEAVGCRFANADCGFALSFARDPDDALWWFPDECIPVDHVLFTDANPGDCDN